MKKKLYIETSVWNQLEHADRPDWHQSACIFIETLKKGYYEAYISNVVLEEIGMTTDEKLREKLMGHIRTAEPYILEIDDEAKELTKKYMAADFIVSSAPKVYNDSSHVAIATINEINHIVSYNFKHLVKDKRIDGFNGVNMLNGYDHVIDITTPDRFIITPEDREQGL
jgi:predicted nucleic acid-binding protein